jgi:hypothetical protein
VFLTHFGPDVQGLWAPMWPPIEKGDYTEAGMVALIEGLRANASLTLCDVSFNFLNADTAAKVRAAGRAGLDLRV